MNNRQKMYQTNTIIRKKLVELDFKNLYFFPHLRFMKDYILEEEGFDAMGWKKNKLYFFQFKTNQKPSKKILKKYKEIEKKYNCKLRWINREKGKIVMYINDLKGVIIS